MLLLYAEEVLSQLEDLVLVLHGVPVEGDYLDLIALLLLFLLFEPTPSQLLLLQQLPLLGNSPMPPSMEGTRKFPGLALLLTILKLLQIHF